MNGIWNLGNVVLYHTATEEWYLSRWVHFLADDGYWSHEWTTPVKLSPTLGLAWYRRGKRIGKI